MSNSDVAILPPYLIVLVIPVNPLPLGNVVLPVGSVMPCVGIVALFSACSSISSSTALTAALASTQQQGFFSKYKWYLVGALILLIVGYLMYKRHKKNKESNPESKVKDIFKSKKK